MTETKHTPGPFVSRCPTFQWWQVISESEGRSVAFIPSMNSLSVNGDYRSNCGDKDAEANAEFFARAGNAHYDLLEALEEVMDIAMQNPSGFDDSSGFDPLDTSPNDMNFHLASMQYHICRAVIAKAKGEEK